MRQAVVHVSAHAESRLGQKIKDALGWIPSAGRFGLVPVGSCCYSDTDLRYFYWGCNKDCSDRCNFGWRRH